MYFVSSDFVFYDKQKFKTYFKLTNFKHQFFYLQKGFFSNNILLKAFPIMLHLKNFLAEISKVKLIIIFIKLMIAS